MSSATHKKAKRGRSQSKTAVETAVAKALESKTKVPAKYKDGGMEVQFIQAWTGSSPYPEVVLSKQHLTQIALGDTSYTRGGGAKKILLKGIQLRGNVDFFNTGVNSGAYLTIVVVYDKDPVGSTANVVGDFLAANAGTDANSNSYNVALNNDGNAQRFQVLRRMDFAINATQTSMCIDTYIKGNKRPVVYRNLGTGAIEDIQTGAVYLMAFQQSRWNWSASTSDPNTSPRVEMSLNSRIRFHEVN